MPITDLSSTDLWKLLETELDASEEHICALPMRTYIKPVRVITVLRTDMEVSATNEECPKGSKDITVACPPIPPPPPVVTKEPPSSFFQKSAEGWKLTGDSTSPTPYYRPPSATALAAIRGWDGGKGQIWFFTAPAKFLGDQLQAFGKLLTYKVWTTEVSSDFLRPEVFLAGGGIEITHDNSPMKPDTWVESRLRLDGTGGWRVGEKGRPATDEDVKKVLANVTSLRISGEFSTLQNDSGWLRDVILGKDG